MAASGIRTIPIIATLVIGVVVGLVVSTIPQVRDSLDAPLGMQDAAQAPGEDAQPGDHTVAELMQSDEYKAVISKSELAALLADTRFKGVFSDAGFQ